MKIAGLPMPVEESRTYLFNRYKSNQYMIGKRVEGSIRGVWMSGIHPDMFSDSWKQVEPIMNGVVDVHHMMSMGDAAEYYHVSRAVAGYSGRSAPGVRLGDSYRTHVINVMGVGQFFHFLNGGDDADTASARALDALVGAGVRLVLNCGRDTVKLASSYDDSAIGWERIIEADSCDYCAMLAGSGNVAKSTSRFHAHDSCYCLARAVFRGQQSVNNEIHQEWQQVTAGKTGKGAEAAWNQYWSGKGGTQRTTAEEPTIQGTGNASIPAERVGLA